MIDELETTESTEFDSIQETQEIEVKESLSETINKAFEEIKDSDDSVKEVKPEPLKTKEVQAIDAPATFTKEQKEFFKTLPPQTRSELLRLEQSRQSYITDRQREIEGYKTRYSEIDQAIKPIERELDLQGQTPGQYLRQMIAADKMIAENPRGALRQMAQNLGLTADDIFGNDDDGDYEQPRNNPEIEALKREISILRQSENQRQDASYSQAVNNLKTTITNFSEARAQDGTLLRPHFGEMLQDKEFTDLVRFNFNRYSNLDTDTVLEKSYRQHLASKPELSASLESERLKKLEKSRNASRSLSSQTGVVGTSKRNSKTLNDAFDNAWAELGGD